MELAYWIQADICAQPIACQSQLSIYNWIQYVHNKLFHCKLDKCRIISVLLIYMYKVTKIPVVPCLYKSIYSQSKNKVKTGRMQKMQKGKFTPPHVLNVDLPHYTIWLLVSWFSFTLHPQSTHPVRTWLHSQSSPNDGLFRLIIHERGISCGGKLYMNTVVVNYRASMSRYMLGHLLLDGCT